LLKSQNRCVPSLHFCPRFGSWCQITAKGIIWFFASTSFLIVIIIFTFSCSPSSSLYSSSSLVFIRPTLFWKSLPCFINSTYYTIFLFIATWLLSPPYSPIQSFSLLFSLLFFSHHLKHHLNFLVFFTTFSRFWTPSLWQCLSKTSVIYKYIKYTV
jgi:hypothetical protein